jgi:F-type H+-transporting ATPase subunit a
MTRINVIMLIMTAALLIFFFMAFRRPQVVPRGIQNVGEVALDFVRVQIAEEILGHHAKRFTVLLTIQHNWNFAVNAHCCQ